MKLLLLILIPLLGYTSLLSATDVKPEIRGLYIGESHLGVTGKNNYIDQYNLSTNPCEYTQKKGHGFGAKGKARGFFAVLP